MAKFILEVSDEYIRERADVELSAKSLENKTGNEELEDLLGKLAFTKIKEMLDKGETEFHLTVDDMRDERGLAIFHTTVSRIGALYLIKDVKSENNETKE